MPLYISVTEIYKQYSRVHFWYIMKTEIGTLDEIWQIYDTWTIHRENFYFKTLWNPAINIFVISHEPREIFFYFWMAELF